MVRRKKLHKLFLYLLLAGLAGACDSTLNGASPNATLTASNLGSHGKAKLVGKKHNSFENITSAVVMIEQVRIRNENGDFLTFTEEHFELDLLDLQGGNADIIVKAMIPNGSYDHIRLITSEEDGVVTLADGSQRALKMPSGAQSGIKIFFDDPITIQNGWITKIVLDFDLSDSFVAQGNGDYLFKPAHHVTVSEYIDENPGGNTEDPSTEPSDGSGSDGSGGDGGDGSGTGGDGSGGDGGDIIDYPWIGV